MATLCRAYPSEALARRAIAGLRAAGLPPQGAQLIAGARRHDRRREPMGEFARVEPPDAPLGTFGNLTLERWRPGGSFSGDPDLQRQGSFADVDGHVVTTHDPGGGEHRLVAGRRSVEALLRAAGLDRDAAERALAQLLAGSALVLVQVAEIGPDEAARALESAGQAA
jgi:hypothetical protein